MSADPIVICALLVQGEPEQVRLILDPYCLDFDLQDVLDVTELPPPAGLAEGSAIHAKVTLKRGAALLQIASAQPYRDLLWQRRTPFALATRAHEVFTTTPSLVGREQAFFAQRGLTELLS
jgi:hypothetical protein